jgi:hypothetical protein
VSQELAHDLAQLARLHARKLRDLARKESDEATREGLLAKAKRFELGAAKLCELASVRYSPEVA